MLVKKRFAPSYAAADGTRCAPDPPGSLLQLNETRLRCRVSARVRQRPIPKCKPEQNRSFCVRSGYSYTSRDTRTFRAQIGTLVVSFQRRDKRQRTAFGNRFLRCCIVEASTDQERTRSQRSAPWGFGGFDETRVERITSTAHWCPKRVT